LLGLASACASCVKFNSLAAGTEWGAPAQAPGDVVHNEEGIAVSVETFQRPTDTSFTKARRGNPFTGFFPSGYSVQTDNINLGFDFTGLSFTTSKVTLDFLDTGGPENISVNGSTIVVGELASGSGGGVSWVVVDSPTGTGTNRKGTVTITGSVQNLKIGGQEFWIDNVCAHR